MKAEIGLEYINNYGDEIIIKDIKNVNNVTIYFKEYDFTKKCKERDLMSSKCPYSKSVYKIGYLGEDFYNYKGISGLDAYIRWRNMLKRCYGNFKGHECYEKVTVCKQWHNFTIFYKWYKENYYEIKGCVMCLDKDIKHKNSFIYSPETCMFVPMSINSIFEHCKREKCKNRNDLPLGVFWIEVDNIYGCRCRIRNNEHKWLGRSNNVIELFNRYAEEKERVIKEEVEKYRNQMPKEVIDALLSYKFEVND